MTPDQWATLKDMFERAIEQPPAQRHAWLVHECAGDAALQRDVESLLQTLDTAGDFLEQPAQVDPGDFEALPAGAVVGSYRIVRELARGGMGVVYLAEDVRLGRPVALKALPAAIARQPDLRERLRREARAAATINHPCVAVVYALEEVDDHLYVAAEYVDGETLRHVIDRGPVPPGRARRIAADVASALAAAHDAGVIHRDLKPENVLLTPDGRVKVVDFGIAQVEGAEASRLTRPGFALGTPAYMAPEQLLGIAVDRRSDIYAWGVVFNEMLTGRHPLAAAGASPLPPGTMATVIGRCLQPDPEARYATARDLLAALRVDDAPATPATRSTARWWWEFHQAAAAAVFWLMVAPAWFARLVIGGTAGRALFFVVLGAVIVSSTLRLHLWFTSRFYDEQLAWARKRSRRWIRIADGLFAAALVAAGLLLRDDRLGDPVSGLAVLLPSVGVGAIVALLLVEPTTARAAFGGRREGAGGARDTAPPAA